MKPNPIRIKRRHLRLGVLFGIVAFGNQVLIGEEKPLYGLVGAVYNSSTMSKAEAADMISTLDQTWGDAEDKETDWAANWEGVLLAPTTGDVAFRIRTNQHVILQINGRPVVEVRKTAEPRTGSIKMIQGKVYPITVIYKHTGGIDGYQRVEWSWSGHPETAIPAKSLRHSKEQERYWNWRSETLPRPARWRVDSAVHVFVYKEPGRFGGWPSNNGIWAWGNEILVGFEQGYYESKTDGDHSFDRDKPKWNVLARSTDGGQTWSVEDPENYVGDGKQAIPCPGPIRFAHPDFAMRVVGGNFFISTDCGKTWEGPYELPIPGQENLTSRTDYLVNGSKDCHVFLSAQADEVQAGFQDRAFCARTVDGGITVQFLSWMTGEPFKVRSVMPATVRISENHLVSAMRRRLDSFFPDRPPLIENWIDAYQSKDNGRTWEFLSKVADTDQGNRNGNPPAMIRLKDGRLCVAYGYRAVPYGIRAKLSNDNGGTWGEEIGLREDGGTWDLGYPRMVQRPDWKIVTIYYFNTKENPEQHIAATIWNPDRLTAR